MDEKALRARLVKSMNEEVVEPAPETEEIPVETEDTAPQTETLADPLGDQAATVMRAYQNANKWLDSIKECLLMDFGCVFFSNYVHLLAHSMPERFDEFGDILHSIDMKVPYPATDAIPSEPTELTNTFDQIFSILNDIRIALVNFNKSIQDTDKSSVGLQVDELILALDREFSPLYTMKRALNHCDNPLVFDKWVAQYINNMSSLID